MKTLLLVLCLSITPAFARVEILVIHRDSPTNTIAIGANEVVSLRKLYSVSSVGLEPALIVNVGPYSIRSGCSQCQAVPLPIKGPSTISLVPHGDLPAA